MRAITAIASPINLQPMVNLDSWQGAAMGVQVNPSGGAEFTIDLTFDNPNDLIYPVPLAQVAWSTTMIPALAVAGTAGLTFSLPTAPIWIRCSLLNGVGQVRATYLQLGRHSRSNISVPQDELLVSGPNFAAVHNGPGNGWTP
jgi:hypothetical protein